MIDKPVVEGISVVLEESEGIGHEEWKVGVIGYEMWTVIPGTQLVFSLFLFLGTTGNGQV